MEGGGNEEEEEVDPGGPGEGEAPHAGDVRKDVGGIVEGGTEGG